MAGAELAEGGRAKPQARRPTADTWASRFEGPLRSNDSCMCSDRCLVRGCGATKRGASECSWTCHGSLHQHGLANVPS